MRKTIFNKRKKRIHAPVRCICPLCGYSELHMKGVPCRTLRCPLCNIPLLPDEFVQESIPTKIVDTKIDSRGGIGKNSKSKDQYPKVDINKCIGCGTCVDACPMKAISISDDVAKIDDTICKKCRKCVNICPVGAIE